MSVRKKAKVAESRKISPALLWSIPPAALIFVFQIYGPALNGPFVFDDLTLPFGGPRAAELPFRAWIGVRPLLMLTYWVNYQLSGAATFSYHVVNVLLHTANAALVFLIVQRILEWAGEEKARRRILAGFAGLIFLAHPLATEAVTYIAGRSETLSVCLFLGALAVFVYRDPRETSWRYSIAILILFAAALTTKEHTAMLPFALLLTDYLWNPGGIRRNWRLYAPMCLAALAGGLFLLPHLRAANTIGFHLKDLTWSQYFFTECRALFLYLRLFLFPAGQSVDHVFPISRSILDHGAIVALLALGALAAAAVHYRKRYPLAAYGLLLSLLLFAPTSSIVPIADPVAERRVYLPMIGLLLIATEALRRAPWRRETLVWTMSAVCLLLAFATYHRNTIWSSDIALEADAVEKAPRNPRAHEQLGFAYFFQHRCDEAAKEYAAAASYKKPDYMLYLNWGVALDCNNELDRAVATLRRAAAMQPTAQAYAALGKSLSRQAKWDEALAALETAVKLDPGFARTYIYRGAVRQDLGQWDAAAADYELALKYDPANENARDLLLALEAQRNAKR